MTYLGKRINVILVILILATVGVVVGGTIFYEDVLRQRTSAYETTSGNLSQCEVQLENYISLLSERESQLNATSQDIRVYDELYQQKEDELSETESELRKRQQELNTVTLQKEQFKELYGEAQTEMARQEALITSLRGTIDDLREENEAQENEIEELTENLNQCQGGGS